MNGITYWVYWVSSIVYQRISGTSLFSIRNRPGGGTWACARPTAWENTGNPGNPGTPRTTAGDQPAGRGSSLYTPTPKARDRSSPGSLIRLDPRSHSARRSRGKHARAAIFGLGLARDLAAFPASFLHECGNRSNKARFAIVNRAINKAIRVSLISRRSRVQAKSAPAFESVSISAVKLGATTSGHWLDKTCVR